MPDEFERLRKAPPGERVKQFLRYANTVIEGKASGRVSLQQAAYTIVCGASFPEVSADPELEAISSRAGELELPAHLVSGDPEERWAEMVRWLREYEAKHRER